MSKKISSIELSPTRIKSILTDENAKVIAQATASQTL